jgi:hypothetical protein
VIVRLHPDDIAAIAAEVARRVQGSGADPDPTPRRRRRPPVNRNGSLGGDAHQGLIATIVSGGAQTGDFRRVVERAIGARFDGAPRVVPDAYGFNLELKRVVLFEVEVSFGLTRRKLDRLCAWRDWLQEHGWGLKLLVCKPHGDRGGMAMSGIDPDTGEWDAESHRHWWDILAGKIDK